METTTELSLGEKRVRINFNPSDNSMVFTIKTKAAEMINLLDTLEAKGDPEIARLKALAMTHVEDAAMWGVKAATA